MSIDSLMRISMFVVVVSIVVHFSCFGLFVQRLRVAHPDVWANLGSPKIFTRSSNRATWILALSSGPLRIADGWLKLIWTMLLLSLGLGGVAALIPSLIASGLF